MINAEHEKELPLVSVIVPVYKVEEYLKTCIESIRTQTYKNMEIILIDDGSPDRCPSICEEYRANDNRIKVIHKKNGGLSDARNVGTKESKGDFILYVDSDDTISNDMVEKMIDFVYEYDADIVVSTYHMSEGDNEYEERFSGDILSGNGCEMLKEIYRLRIWSAWGKLFRRELALKNNFIKGLVYEDYEYIPKVFLQAKRVVISLDGRYQYLIRPTSIMGKSKKKINTDIVHITEKNLKLFNANESLDEDSKRYFRAKLIRHLYYEFTSIYRNDSKKENEELVKLTKQIFSNNLRFWVGNKYLPIKYQFGILAMLISCSLGKVVYDMKR